MWGGISLWFWFLFFWWLVILNIFSCTCWPFVCFLWKNVCSVSLLYLNQIACFLLLSCVSSLYIIWVLTHFIYDLQVFYLIRFHFVGDFLCCAEASEIDIVPLIYFCFCCLCLWCPNPKKKKSLLNDLGAYPSIFSSRNFIITGLLFKSLIHFESVFVYGVR